MTDKPHGVIREYNGRLKLAVAAEFYFSIFPHARPAVELLRIQIAW